LLEARVRSADPRFALTEESLPLVVDICRRLDGLPLAIELAAARIATIGLRPVRDKLEARFSLLTGGARASLRRHQTLRAALEWSHNLLNDDERAVFRRLGVFAGGFTMALAQAVAVDARLDEWAVLDHLSALIDKSLVVTEGGDSPRYRLLESARAFALEQLAADETEDTLRRHALAMRDFLQRVDSANLDGELRTHEFAALVLPELDNLRAAYLWAARELGDPELAIALAAHAGSITDYTRECGDWLLAQRQAAESSALPAAVSARYWRALAAGNMVGHVSRAQQIDAAQRARSLYASLGQPRRVYSSLIQVARHRIAQNDPAAARKAADEARALLQPDWPAEHRIVLLRMDGYIAQITGRQQDALALYRECVRASAGTGDWRLEVMARSNLSDILWKIGPIEDAAREIGALLDALRERPATYMDMVVAHANAMGILSESGRIDDAAAIAPEALSLMQRAGEYYLEEWLYFFWRRGQMETAARLLGAVEAHRARLGEAFQPNEQRLVDHARAGLAAALPPEVLAECRAAGGVIATSDLRALIAEGLKG
jgi:tetratricopeptide (TPR) repeat protein